MVSECTASQLFTFIVVSAHVDDGDQSISHRLSQSFRSSKQDSRAFAVVVSGSDPGQYLYAPGGSERVFDV